MLNTATAPVSPQATHTTESDRVWNTLCSNSLAHIRKFPVDPRFEINIRRLGLLDGGMPTLEEINNRLRAATGWSMYPATGDESKEEILIRFAKREHPILVTLRPMAKVDRADSPDMWHDAWGHGWMLYDPTFAQIYEAMGRQAELVAGTDRFTWLVSLHNKLHEFGLHLQDGVLVPRGAAIYSSIEEMKNALKNRKVRRMLFDPACPADVQRAMRTEFLYSDLQLGYFILDGDEVDLLALLKSDLGPHYEALKGLPFLKPGEPCETDHHFDL